MNKDNFVVSLTAAEQELAEQIVLSMMRFGLKTNNNILVTGMAILHQAVMRNEFSDKDAYILCETIWMALEGIESDITPDCRKGLRDLAHGVRKELDDAGIGDPLFDE